MSSRFSLPACQHQRGQSVTVQGGIKGDMATGCTQHIAGIEDDRRSLGSSQHGEQQALLSTDTPQVTPIDRHPGLAPQLLVLTESGHRQGPSCHPGAAAPRRPRGRTSGPLPGKGS